MLQRSGSAKGTGRGRGVTETGTIFGGDLVGVTIETLGGVVGFNGEINDARLGRWESAADTDSGHVVDSDL